ncbi:hypothetical protein ACFXB3_35315 [Streptomyces sp. NPDC059447]|uniref:hypothetical protein n=1 Tax=Streptomyces sp. NPDC059447 TaxID=3346834 RepID=UPI0036D09B8E
MDETPAYTDTRPDGRHLTWDDLQAGDLVQVLVGRWPHDTEFANVNATHGLLVSVTFERYGGTQWIKQNRIASILRPIPE